MTDRYIVRPGAVNNDPYYPNNKHDPARNQPPRRLNPQQQANARNIVLQPNYLCDRCKQPGHYIQDCPTNENQLFEPYKPSGVPMSQIWRQNGTNAREW